ncbi:hypothetical protein PIB30_037888 [Stylosanthes scabra]|uniref:Uncharacterized protein n=1 Tax=Stylosanthes scabra TaxID=79078 RepID=A0ABU6ZAQ8_9FABA|nr:hypothetical protein [Stylosanthes scabra]
MAACGPFCDEEETLEGASAQLRNTVTPSMAGNFENLVVESSKLLLPRLKMVYFDIKLYDRGYFGYVDGVMRYVGGRELTIVDNDSDFWSIYVAEEQLRRLGH